MQLHADLATLAREGVTHLAIEASSHGLDQHRLDGLRLSAAGFTNLTHEHLDYHAVDGRLLRGQGAAVREPAAGRAARPSSMPTAIAPRRSPTICARRGIRFWTYGAKGREFRLLQRPADAAPASISWSRCWASVHEIELPLVGGFQASNALARARPRRRRPAAMSARAVAALATLSGAPGRLQLVARHRTGAPVYVDYAHKPEALETVLGDAAARSPAASWSWCSAAAAIATAASGR